ncbi:MAG: FmdB family zinc ribbon protein [Oceanococcaceae bacterium]
MPIYEYVCRSCGHEMEVLQKISDPVLSDCPACADSSLQKKVSAAGFRLAGSGWYETDFKSSGKRNLAGGGESKSESKTADAKPAAPKSAASDAA